MKSSLLNEEARWKDRESIINLKALVTDGDMNRGRGKNRSPHNREKLGRRSKLRGRPTCFYCGKLGHFLKEKAGADGVGLKKNPNSKNTPTISASEEEILFICKQNEANLVGEELTWVVDSGASFHLTPNRECFSSYTAGDYDEDGE